MPDVKSSSPAGDRLGAKSGVSPRRRVIQFLPRLQSAFVQDLPTFSVDERFASEKLCGLCGPGRDILWITLFWGQVCVWMWVSCWRAVVGRGIVCGDWLWICLLIQMSWVYCSNLAVLYHFVINIELLGPTLGPKLTKLPVSPLGRRISSNQGGIAIFPYGDVLTQPLLLIQRLSNCPLHGLQHRPFKTRTENWLLTQ